MAKKISIPIEGGKKALDFLRKVDLAKVDFDHVKKRTDILVRCGFSAGHFEPLKHWIFRGVVVKVEETPTIKKVGRISYRPKKVDDVFSLNRASTNKYQIFYGSIPTPDFDDAKIAAVLEIDTIRQEDFPEDEYEYIAMGMWFVKKPFIVVSAGMNSTIALNNQWAKTIVVKDHEFLEDAGNGDFVKEVMQFMGNEFGREVPKGEDHLYKISAAYGNSLFDIGIHAIMFPSLQTGGKSFNIAIRSEVIDFEGIDIEAAAIMRGSKIKKEVFWGWYLQCERIYGDALVWTEPPIQAQISGNDLDRFRRIIGERGGFAAPLK